MTTSDHRLRFSQTTTVQNFEVFPSAARTATATSAVFMNRTSSGIMLFIDCTADPASASVVVSIQAIDPVSGEAFPIATFTAFAATGNYLKILYPGADEDIVEANAEQQGLPLPAQYQIVATHADTDSITYSIGASTL